MLVQLRPRVAFEAQAAASWARAEADNGGPIGTNRTTESRAEQFVKYYAYQAYKYGRGPWAPFALHPDFSWHCEPRARAVDTNNHRWFRERPQYGWRFEVKEEPWHGQYYPHLDLLSWRGWPSGSGASPFIPTATPLAPETESDSDMRVVQLDFTPNLEQYVIDTQYIRRLMAADGTTPDYAAANRLAGLYNPGGKGIGFSEWDWYMTLDALAIDRAWLPKLNAANGNWWSADREPGGTREP